MGGCTSKKISTSQSRDPHNKKSAVCSEEQNEKEQFTSMSSNHHRSFDGESKTADQNGAEVSEEASRGRVVTMPKPELKPSKLEDAQRRRLSVSTVQVHEDVPDVQHTVDKKSLIELREYSGVSFDSNKNVDSSLSPESTSATTGENHSSTRSKIKKYPDPALELLNEKAGSIRQVSLDMIMDLVSESDSTYMIFGAPSQEVQKGFDNKKMHIIGSLAGQYDPTAHGIGYACRKGLKPESPNQDDFFIIKVDDWALYGVFDGHGPYGHDVSGFIHRALPFLIIADPNFETDPAFVMKRAFRKAHHLLEALSEGSGHLIDCSLSGTTGTIILHRDNKLFVAHVGDSRGVLALKSNERIRAVDLSQDHKPTREDEKKRIEACGGEVRRLEGDIPHRVFVKNRIYPGLAMSRALGDTVGAAVGVIPDPDVKIMELHNENDQFVIVSTDGVWEFISSQEAVDFVCQKKRAEVQKAADFIAYESWRRWVEEEENVVDDVTCIIFWVGNESDLVNSVKSSSSPSVRR